MMNKTYDKIWIFFVLILCFTFLGFYKSYFVLFTSDKPIPASHHFHTALFLFWFLLIFIQPVLIKRGYLKLHRFLGRSSYVMMPLLVFSVYIMTRNQFQREIRIFPLADCIAHLIIPLPQLVIFVAMYILAVIHAKDVGLHVRYILCASLVLIGPGLGRAFISLGGISYENSVQFSFIVTELILIALLYFDSRKGKNYRPYLIQLVIFACCHAGWFFIPYSIFWQKLGGAIAHLFFT
jgi:hypothetical protein